MLFSTQNLRIGFILLVFTGVFWVGAVNMYRLVGAFCAAALAVSLVCPAVFAQEDSIADDLLPLSEAAQPNIDYFDKDTFSTRSIICPFKGAIDYDAGDIACGLIEVPENREKTNPRFIELHYVKIAAREPDDWDAEESGEWIKRDDPIIYLTGGPGVKVQGYVDRLREHGVTQARDLYILEQRGIGWSGDFCPTYFLQDPTAANTSDWDQYQRAGLEAMETCFAAAQAAKVDLSGYSSIENARDVKALRQALGFEQWNAWGISYGSILGQAYLKEDPEGVRAAVIDAIVPLQQDITFHHIARYYDRVLTMLDEACIAHGDCAKNFPDFKTRLEAAIMKTSMAPIEVEAIDDELFPSGSGYFFQDIIGGVPFVLFYEQDNYATLPAFIDSFVRLVEKENYEPFRFLTAGGAPAVDISQGMYNAIACNDNWHAAMQKAFEDDFTAYPALSMIFGDPALVEEQARICKRYGAVPRSPEDYLPVNTDIRTLIVEGAMDPITPPPLAKAILAGFSNGTYVEFPFAGHGPTRSVECAGDFLTKFYDAPNGELDVSCVDEMTPPEFTGALFETSAFTKLGALAAEDEKKLVAPLLWAGLPALVFVFGTIIYTLAPAARLINGAAGHPTSGARPLAWVTSVLGLTTLGGLGYGAYASFEANQFLLLVGMLGWVRWFAVAGLAAGVAGLLLLWLTLKARMRQPLPIGVLGGLLLTGASGAALAVWVLAWGLSPF